MTLTQTITPALQDRTAPTINKIGTADLWNSLRKGLDDFNAKPSHYVFLALIYPVVGIILGVATANARALPMLYPLVSGFAMLGPVAALVFYEISRRKELGEDPHWKDALAIFHGPLVPSILKVTLLLLAIFVLWLVAAQILYDVLLPIGEMQGYGDIANMVTMPQGWPLIIVGNFIGFLFAAAAFSVSVVSLPLILDRQMDAVTAVRTSLKAVARNPVPMAAWGAIVAGLLLLGSLPLLMGLAVVIPVLGHSTWHLYRRLVAD